METNKCEGFPKFYGFGKKNSFHYLILELLGDSLNFIVKSLPSRRFNLFTVCKLALCLLKRLEVMHNLGFIHRDVKPDNILKDLQSETIYLIDYGFSKRYRDKNTREHVKYKQGTNIVGTIKYMSINTQSGVEQSRRDDLESLFYVLIYFFKSSLPWRNEKNEKEANDKILTTKMNIDINHLCSGMPEEFKSIVNSIRKLRFDEKPPYDMYASLLKKIIIAEGDKTLSYVSLNFAVSESDLNNRKKRIKAKTKNVFELNMIHLETVEEEIDKKLNFHFEIKDESLTQVLIDKENQNGGEFFSL